MKYALCLLIALPWNAAAFQDQCGRSGDETFGELIERWSWETFWKGHTGGFHYQPKSKASAEVFWNAELVGMCSLELSACVAYERERSTIGQLALAVDKVSGTRLGQATEAFLLELGKPRVVGVAGKSAKEPRKYEGGGKVLAIPNPDREVIVPRNVRPLQRCIVSQRTFPPLDSPKAIRGEIKPVTLERFEVWLRARLHPGPPGSKNEYVIPYYSPSDPMVYVLVRVNGVTESVIFAISEPSGENWTIGGHFDVKESPAETSRLSSRILAARMTTVGR